MLDQLYIKNFAIIAEASIPFAKGLNILTGETGAGKSILIDALGLQLGDRAETGFIRQGATRAEIQAEFSLEEGSACLAWLAAQELDNPDDDEPACRLRRTLSENGKSQSYINATPTTLTNTKTLGEMLVDIHGQHAHQSLLAPDKQLQLLDSFADHPELLAVLRTTYQQLRMLIKKRDAQEGTANQEEQLALLTYQIEEMQQLALSETEFQQLSDQQKTLAAAAEIIQHTDALQSGLDGEQGVRQSLQSLLATGQKLLQLDDKASELVALLEQLNIYADEARDALQHYQSHIELDDARLQQVELRMSALHDMARKHRVDPEALYELQNVLQDKAAILTESLGGLESLTQDIADGEAQYQQAARALSASRQAKAEQLSEQVSARLSELGMAHAYFRVQFDEQTKPNSSGCDKVVFLFSPNPGQGERPLHKIASGGELSRVSLAIQVSSLQARRDTTLIFDEVDSGIGGAVAEVVGRLLKTLAQHNQVICVTHLPQVAVFADQHILIEKHSDATQTQTHFKKLSKHDRISEIARMTGGLSVDAETLAYAEKTLQQAEQFTQSLLAQNTM